MTEAVERARSLLLDSFVWTDGHADFAGVLRQGAILAAVGPALAELFQDEAISAVVGMEARGFVFGALVARSLDVGLILARKSGSVHPGAATELATEPDWRGRLTEVRISRGAVAAGDRLLLVDDWVETGSQAGTVARLITRLGAQLVGVASVVDDATDRVRESLNLRGVVRSTELYGGAP